MGDDIVILLRFGNSAFLIVANLLSLQYNLLRTTKAYWQTITITKHPSVAKYTAKVKETLESPDEIRRSKQDPSENFLSALLQII